MRGIGSGVLPACRLRLALRPRLEILAVPREPLHLSMIEGLQRQTPAHGHFDP